MKFFSKTLILFIVIMMIVPVSSFAMNRESIEKIIEGEQDYLVFGSIDTVDGGGICSLDITYVVCGDDETANVNEDEAENESEEEQDSSAESVKVRESISVGSNIVISNLNSYLYYEDRTPRIGDNVLLSLKFAGNVYYIENGAFMVTEADYDSFKIKAPEKTTDSGEYAEITAVYHYVKSKGKNSDFVIKDDSVYTHQSGHEKELDKMEGVDITDDDGVSKISSSEKQAAAEKETEKSGFSLPIKDNWIFALIILVAGSAVGVVITHLSVKMEKRSDKK